MSEIAPSLLERRLSESGVPRARALELAAAGSARGGVQRGPVLDGQALDRPLVIMLAGTAGVGKSTLATLLAHELGVTRVIATDAIREVVRAFFSLEHMPTVHCSS